MFKIESLALDGWSDDAALLGRGITQDENQWGTEAEALAACDELAGVFDCPRASLRVVEAEPAPTVDEILAGCKVRGWQGDEPLLAWNADGGEIAVPASELRGALEAAYDPSMLSWPATVDVDA